MKMKYWPWIALGLILGVGVAGGESFAHGDEEHAGRHEAAEHMQAMMALKDKIPEEFRIMERTPIIPDDESLAQGKDLYRQQCVVCHGKEGRGDGPAAKNMSTPPANFLNVEHSNIYGPGEKYWIIGHGSGKTGMPGFSQIGLVDRWNLVNFVLDLQ